MELNQEVWQTISAAEKRDVRNLVKCRLGTNPLDESPVYSDAPPASCSPSLEIQALHHCLDGLLVTCHQQPEIASEVVHALQQYLQDFQQIMQQAEKWEVSQSPSPPPDLQDNAPNADLPSLMSEKANLSLTDSVEHCMESDTIGDKYALETDLSMAMEEDHPVTPIGTYHPVSWTSSPSSATSLAQHFKGTIMDYPALRTSDSRGNTTSPLLKGPITLAAKRPSAHKLSFVDDVDQSMKAGPDEQDTTLDSSVMSERPRREDSRGRSGNKKRDIDIRRDSKKVEPPDSVRKSESRKRSQSEPIKDRGVVPWTPERLASQGRERLTEAELQERIESKLSHAREIRERLEQEKRERLQQYHTKIIDASGRRERMLETLKWEMEQRNERAEMKAKEQLSRISSKAHDEVEKVQEILWMQAMNRENARQEIKLKDEALEARREERISTQRKRLAEKEEHEKSVHERRAALEAERLERQQARDMKKEDVALKLERQRKMMAAARESKMGEHAAKVEQQKTALQAEQEEKMRLHQEKMDTSARNRATHVEKIREKAAAEVEKAKEIALRKECGEERRISFRDILAERCAATKKRQQRIQQTADKLGKEYQEQYKKDFAKEKRSPIMRFIGRLNACLPYKHARGCTSVLKEMVTYLAKEGRSEADFVCLRQGDGYDVLMQLCTTHGPTQEAVLRAASGALLMALQLGTQEDADYIVRAGYLVPLIDLLANSLANGDATDLSALAPLSSLFSIVEICITHMPSNASGRVMQSLVLSYLDVSGLSASLQALLTIVHHPLDATGHELIYNSLSLLNAAINATTKQQEQSGQRKELYRLVVESVFGLLTALLLPHAPRSGSPTPQSKAAGKAVEIVDTLPRAVITIAFLSMRILNNVARVHLEGLQGMVATTLKAEFYHVAAFLLSYIVDHVDDMEPIGLCHADPSAAFPALPGLTIDVPPKASAIHNAKYLRVLLHEMLLVMGYLAIQSYAIQEMFRWGHAPNLLQQLCNLPVAYFSTYKHILFPTLIIVCFNNPLNKEIILHEVSAAPVAKFIIHCAEAQNIDLTAVPKKEVLRVEKQPLPVVEEHSATGDTAHVEESPEQLSVVNETQQPGSIGDVRCTTPPEEPTNNTLPGNQAVEEEHAKDQLSDKESETLNSTSMGGKEKGNDKENEVEKETEKGKEMEKDKEKEKKKDKEKEKERDKEKEKDRGKEKEKEKDKEKDKEKEKGKDKEKEKEKPKERLKKEADKVKVPPKDRAKEKGKPEKPTSSRERVKERAREKDKVSEAAEEEKEAGTPQEKSSHVTNPPIDSSDALTCSVEDVAPLASEPPDNSHQQDEEILVVQSVPVPLEEQGAFEDEGPSLLEDVAGEEAAQPVNEACPVLSPAPATHPATECPSASPGPSKGRRKKKELLRLGDSDAGDATGGAATPVAAKEYRPACQSPFFVFSRRFPVELWPDAKKFFET